MRESSRAQNPLEQRRSILFWNGLHVCLQIAALVVCIEARRLGF